MSAAAPIGLAIVGCGFVADYYLQTVRLHPGLSVRGLHDRLPDRARALAGAYGQSVYPTLEAALADPAVQIVLNLTNPREHHAVSRQALLAGKHVYSEKPIAMEMDQARELVDMAESRGLQIVSAPCSLLGETAQTLWRALRHNAVGRVRLVYAEMDDGLVHRMPYRKWQSVSGVPWPYKDEFEVGCTLEHAGYYVTWLAAWFGPAKAVTAFASVQVPDKLPAEPLTPPDAPDFSVACIEFDSGVVARLTCSIVAPHDHTLRVIGDEGVLSTHDCWHYRSPVWHRRLLSVRRKTFLSPFKTRHRLPAPPHGKPQTKGAQVMDFARGPAELADALREGRLCRITPRFSLHVNEIALAIHHAARVNGLRQPMTTTFEPLQPMPWAG
ncbi:Gfo/Idh/MocA family protein [Aquabacterium sp. J223]|uniref:Gfo/Idh/MocA family protein n=1 Tax=Aquabacterium sp. J223 TaxID=2898431 RepID=UPI0021AE1EC0|nr:Gfo/Idh/MocA family oxidoreductase [Aquabacterium sp. J223]UUX96834.1 Gfo/Idh/MocA family oxidoreductase [Aquabacterium sp. J223]